jgi:hypothetical protein
MTLPTEEQVAEASRKFGRIFYMTEEERAEKGDFVTGRDLATMILLFQRDAAKTADELRTHEARIRELERQLVEIGRRLPVPEREGT